MPWHGPTRFRLREWDSQSLDSEKMSLKPDTPLKIALRRARPTSGIVVTPAGEPIAGAKLIEFARVGDDSGGNTPGRHWSYVGGDR